MKFNKGIYHVVFLLGTAVFLTACPSKGGGGSTATVDSTTSQFIQEFNSRVGSSSTEADSYNPFILRSDGRIEYYREVNRYCRIRWTGNLEKVSLQDRIYTITYSYRYNNFINEGDICNTRYYGWNFCEEKMQECRNYVYSRSKGSKTEMARQGRGLDYLKLRP